MEIARCPVCGEPGTIHLRWQRCGKPNCKCARGELHGPYPEVNHVVGWRIDQNGKEVCDDYRCYVSKKALAAKENARIRFLVATLARNKPIKEYVPRRPKKGLRPIDETSAKLQPVAKRYIVKETPESSGWDQAREPLGEKTPKAAEPQSIPVVKQQSRPVAVPQPAPVVEKPVVEEPVKRPCPYANVSRDYCRSWGPSGHCMGEKEFVCLFEPTEQIVVKSPCPEYGSGYCRQFARAGWCPQTDFYRCRLPKVTL